MIILLWVRVCRVRLASLCRPGVHNVGSSPQEKSETRHIGSSPPEKGDFGSGDVDGLGQSVDARNATNKCATGTRQSHELPWLCRFLAGLSPVSSIDASDVIGRRFKKGRRAT
jgi:hypothetical protein